MNHALPIAKEQKDMSIPNTEAHHFDFFFGKWRVHHRRLENRLAGSTEWIEFDGTAEAMPLMGGYGNVDDNVINLPEGAYRAVTLRALDPSARQRSIWWLDGRSTSDTLDPPVRGGFSNGVGTFYANDSFNGKPIRVRYLWSQVTPKSCHWEQAFSPNAGKTWETNWKMHFTRAE
jgi:hypothetical protein